MSPQEFTTVTADRLVGKPIFCLTVQQLMGKVSNFTDGLATDRKSLNYPGRIRSHQEPSLTEACQPMLLIFPDVFYRQELTRDGFR